MQEQQHSVKKARSTSTTLLPTTTSFFSTLPPDLIVLIAFFIDSAHDLLSFSLMCKKCHGLVLANIKDKTNKQSQQLLNLHLTRVIGISGAPNFQSRSSAFAYTCLPNHIDHGVAFKWTLEKKQIEQLMKLAKEDRFIRDTDKSSDDTKTNSDNNSKNNSNSNGINPASQLPNPHRILESGYIITQEKQNEALDIIHQYGSFAWEGRSHFGRPEGASVDYHWSGDPQDTLKLRQRRKWSGGVLSSELIYDLGGHIIKETRNVEGMQQGWRFFNHNDKMISKSQIRDNLRHGETDEYKIIEGCDYPALWTRCHFVNGKEEGSEEVFEPESGVRTALSYWQNGKKIGNKFLWSTDGALQEHQVWEEGRMINQLNPDTGCDPLPRQENNN